MKKLLFYLLILTGIQLNLSAQTLVLDCETSATSQSTANNRNYDMANCWSFNGVTYTTANKITGDYSTLSDVANDLTPITLWIKSPWFKPGSGNITLKTKLHASSGNSRFLRLAYIPYNSSLASPKEGTRVDFYTYTFSTSNTNIIDISQAIPSAIANSSQPYKIMVMFYGSGGTSKILTDDWSIPGTYWADPSSSCLPLTVIQDADSDGVADADDAYPNDATRAYNNWYPAAGFGTLMYEDLWPATGDYDFNDLVLDYRYNLVTNASNKVVEMKSKIVTRAIGGSFRNGFAFQLNGLSPSKVTAVTGTRSFGANWISNAANGCDNGQTYANIVVYDDAQQILPSPGGSGTNVILTNGYVAPDTTSVTLTFTAVSGQMIALSEVVFNPYIIVNQVRGKEVHLPDYLPSSKASSGFFGQDQDNTNPGLNRYYKTINNLPWALNVTSSIPYTHTTNDFISGYLHFAEWAQSGGSSYTDWFSNTGSGYRDNTKLYIR